MMGLILSFTHCKNTSATDQKSSEDKESLKKGRSLEKRIQSRDYPSVFAAWNNADNKPEESELNTYARHDLIFHAPHFYGLEWNNQYQGLAKGFTKKSIKEGLEVHKTLLNKNPNLILLAEIRYRDASTKFLPENHKWWMRNEDGTLAEGWAEGGFLKLDFTNDSFQNRVAQKAAAAVESGVAEGVMLDWWHEGRRPKARIELIKKVREAIGEDALIIVNSNDRKIPKSKQYVNGLFMECYRSETAEDWQRIATTLSWAETNLRKPTINLLETWFHNSREDYNLMRATTTLSLTHSEGYCLFSDPNELDKPDHAHNWYSFWNANLGVPEKEGKKQEDGSWVRKYSNGTALYNPMGNKTVTTTFSEKKYSCAKEKYAKSFKVQPADGDIFLKKDIDINCSQK